MERKAIAITAATTKPLSAGAAAVPDPPAGADS